MRTLLIAEHNNTSLSDATAPALTAACEMGAPVDILVAGYNCAAAAEAAATLTGVERVLVIERPEYEHPVAEQIVSLILQWKGDYGAFVAAGTTFGKNVMPRLAARLDVMQLSDIIKVVSPTTFQRSIYAGSIVQTVETLTSVRVVTVRISAFEPAQRGGNAQIVPISAEIAAARSHFVSEQVKASNRPELTSARFVISGGRGLGSAENFKHLLEPLADKLGAGIGASRAAVDSGFAPNEWQVGQTGKIIAPDLYLAVGISGAIQHIAGMKDSKTIIAVNRDEEAPIFKVADYGLVGDLFEVLPQVSTELEKSA